MYQINYLRCIGCGLHRGARRGATMTYDKNWVDDNRADLIYEKDRLLALLLPEMVPRQSRIRGRPVPPIDYFTYRGTAEGLRGARWSQTTGDSR